MKIGILTFPLRTNYGGLLQAYALQTVLKRMWHEVWMIRREGRQHGIIKYLRKLKAKIKLLQGIEMAYIFPEHRIILEQNTSRFVQSYINPKTVIIEKESLLKRVVSKLNLEAYVVGSDQVWRFGYSSYLANFFLDFVPQTKIVKRVAYAVSFGLNQWNYPEIWAKRCSDLAKKFNAISVREDMGVVFCQKYLSVNAVHVLDPTMLLDKTEYMAIAETAQEKQSPGNLFYYILDEAKEKTDLINSIELSSSLRAFTVMPLRRATPTNLKNHIEDCVFPPVSKWLRAYMDAKFVVTDSFHGTVFSIIFNKPFVVVVNMDRGIARIHSLLKMFGLQERLLHSFDEEIVKQEIDWDRVNKELDKWKSKSLDFLSKNLGC